MLTNAQSNEYLRSSKRLLEPNERIAEVLFGLIMVLTFTGSLSVAEAGQAEVRTMLIGAIGCNLAWGIIDGVFYLMGCLNERAIGIRALRALHLSLIHISEPTRQAEISYAVFCLKKKKKQ